MRFINLTILVFFMLGLNAQPYFDADIDTIQLKKYLNHLKKRGDSHAAAEESILLAKTTLSDQNIVEALKLNAQIDSFHRVAQFISGLKNPLLRMKWSNVHRVFSSTVPIRGSDSIYLNFIRGTLSGNNSHISEYYTKNKSILKTYYFRDRFFVFSNKPRKRRAVAAVLSIFPGLGKLYIGRNMDALGNFTNTALLSGLTLVFAKHLGQHPLTYVSGALAGGFYVAGILGTQTSLVHNRHFKKDIIYEEVIYSFKHYIATL
jgi:TM2 domain-containing membrane protein YozV